MSYTTLKHSACGKPGGKLVRHEYQSPIPSNNMDDFENGHACCLPVLFGSSKYDELRSKKNINPAKPELNQLSKLQTIKGSSKGLNDGGNNVSFSEQSDSIGKICKMHDFKGSYSKKKKDAMIHQHKLMEKLLKQNFPDQSRTIKGKLSKKKSSHLPVPRKATKDDPVGMKGDFGDKDKPISSTVESENKLQPLEGFIIKKTKITESDLFEITDSPNVADEPEPEKEIKMSSESNADLYRKVVTLKENIRLIKDENHMLKKRLRHVQDLKVDNFILKEAVVQLENKICLLTSENEEIQKKLNSCLANSNENKKALKSSQSYTIAILEPKLKDEKKEISNSYSNRLLSMEERVADIVSILEIMKSLVLEQKAASESTEKRVHQFIDEINTVGLLQNLLKEYTTKSQTKS